MQLISIPSAGKIHMVTIAGFNLLPFYWNCWNSLEDTSNIKRTVVGNKIVDHSDVAGASTSGAAPTTSSFST